MLSIRKAYKSYLTESCFTDSARAFIRNAHFNLAFEG